MGLDTTHDAWHGAYSAFARWRRVICEMCGLGNIDRFEGYGKGGIIPLDIIQDEGIRLLLSHSDCDGEFSPDECFKIAESLTRLINGPINNNDEGGHIGLFKDKTKQFIDGCMLAYTRGETMYFR